MELLEFALFPIGKGGAAELPEFADLVLPEV